MAKIEDIAIDWTRTICPIERAEVNLRHHVVTLHLMLDSWADMSGAIKCALQMDSQCVEVRVMQPDGLDMIYGLMSSDDKKGWQSFLVEGLPKLLPPHRITHSKAKKHRTDVEIFETPRVIHKHPGCTIDKWEKAMKQ